MVDYKQILRLRAQGVSQRGIADVLGCSRNTVAAVFAARVRPVSASGRRRTSLRRGPSPAAARGGEGRIDRVSPDFEYVHRELARPSVTLLLLWNEYVANCRASGGVPYR